MDRVGRRLTVGLMIASGCLMGCPKGGNNPDSGTDAGIDAGTDAGFNADAGLTNINHFVVIYLENHSFDNLYGEFSGAENLASSAALNAPKQLDPDGVPYVTLPMPAGSTFSTTLPNSPFVLDPYLSGGDAGTPSDKSPDLVHRFYQEQAQINDGGMNYFALVSDVKGESMGYYHTSQIPLSTVASQYVLCDHFFHGAFGGSFLNHFWLISAAAPTFPLAQATDAGPGVISSVIVPLDGGSMASDGFVTPDGFAVNTCFTVNDPHPPGLNNSLKLVPNQTMPNIGDRLSAAGLDWKWYSGEWNQALAYVANDAGVSPDRFQYHHQPFAYFATTANGTAAKEAHLKDELDFYADVDAGTLPAVSFIKPAGPVNEHPGYTDVLDGEKHVLDLLARIQASANWKDTVVIITYDENGGYWDHVAPPKVDSWGPGTRVPAIIVSPFAKRGFVDSTVYDTTSILTTIEHRWALPPLNTRDANATDLSNAFDFTTRH